MIVYKLNHDGEEVLHYAGDTIERRNNLVIVRAIFQFHVVVTADMTFEQGDIFTEWFYSDRWYNIFRVDSGATGALKGFYCNITRPAIITNDSIRADDLALDVLVLPDGTRHLLDEDDYEALNLSSSDRDNVQNALTQIYRQIDERQPPFNVISES